MCYEDSVAAKGARCKEVEASTYCVRVLVPFSVVYNFSYNFFVLFLFCSFPLFASFFSFVEKKMECIRRVFFFIELYKILK